MIPGVRYPYGQDVIDDALRGGTALTHRFVRTAKGWYLHTTADIPEKKPATGKITEAGCIGVDINEKEIAVSETDRFGNLVWHTTYPSCVKDRSTEQTKASYGDITALIVSRAAEKGKPVAHETLDFKKKKASMKEQGVLYSRMLSGFAYSSFQTMLDRRAFRSGVRVYSVNPAYTSVIGKMNYMARYGLTPHESAALVIARRAQRYTESPDPTRTAFPLPARNRGKHVWSYWRRCAVSKACDNLSRLYSWRSLQDSSGCAALREKHDARTTAQSSRPPALPHVPYSMSEAPGEIPINKLWGLRESGRESLTLIGRNTVRLPS